MVIKAISRMVTPRERPKPMKKPMKKPIKRVVVSAGSDRMVVMLLTFFG